LPQFLNDNIPAEREMGLGMSLEMLARCDRLWAFGGVASPGMRGEIMRARALGIPVRFYDSMCLEAAPFM
jgi:hypothetical protein